MNDGRQGPFDEAFRSWAERSPRIPAREAARQVVARLPARQKRERFSGNALRLAAAAAGLSLLLIVGWYTVPIPPDPSSTALDLDLPPLSEDVVLLWLDDETPLYLTVARPATKGGS